MRKGFVMFILVVMLGMVSPLVSAKEQVRIAGFVNDQVIVEEMILQFVNPQLQSQGIEVIYEPIADDYQRYIVNALSAGTGPDLFY